VPPSAAVRFNRPVWAATGLDGREIVPLECILVFQKIQFPEREEIVGDIQTFVARMRTIKELMACIHTYLSEVLRYLREVIEVNHSPPKCGWQPIGPATFGIQAAS
jgi:hypothetical protein